MTYSDMKTAMRRSLAALSIAAAGLLAAPAQAATYLVDFTADKVSMTGRFVIDGTGYFDITAFGEAVRDFTLTAEAPGLQPFTFTSENAEFGHRRLDTVGGKYVYFDVTGEALTLVTDRGSVYSTYNQFLISRDYVDGKKPNLIFAKRGLTYFDVNGDRVVDYGYGEKQLIGVVAAVPLPAGAALMLPVIAGAGLLSVRRRATSRPTEPSNSKAGAGAGTGAGASE